MRLNYGHPSIDNIVEDIKTLGTLLKGWVYTPLETMGSNFAFFFLFLISCDT